MPQPNGQLGNARARAPDGTPAALRANRFGASPPVQLGFAPQVRTSDTVIAAVHCLLQACCAAQLPLCDDCQAPTSSVTGHQHGIDRVWTHTCHASFKYLFLCAPDDLYFVQQPACLHRELNRWPAGLGTARSYLTGRGGSAGRHLGPAGAATRHRSDLRGGTTAGATEPRGARRRLDRARSSSRTGAFRSTLRYSHPVLCYVSTWGQHSSVRTDSAPHSSSC